MDHAFAVTYFKPSLHSHLLDLLWNKYWSKLGLNENMTRQAMQLFKESKSILLSNMSSLGSGLPEEIERLGKVGRKENGGITLCQILRTFSLNIVDFFNEMPRFCIKVGSVLAGLYGLDCEKRLQSNGELLLDGENPTSPRGMQYAFVVG